MSEVSSPWVRGGWTSQFSVAAKKVAVRGPSTTDSNVLQVEGVLFWAKPFLHQEAGFVHSLLRFCRAETLFQPRRGRTKNSLLGSTPQHAGDPWLLTSARGHGVSAAKPTWWRLVARDPEACDNYVPFTGVAVLRSRGSVPVWTATTGPSPSGAPWPQAGGPTVPGPKPGTVGFRGNGDVVTSPALRKLVARSSSRSSSRTVRLDDWTRLT
jgi:hypothetical protein